MKIKLSQALFAQAEVQLQQARAALDAKEYGECEKLAYQASETIASGYLSLSNLDQPSTTPTEAAFDKFAAVIREPTRHPDKIAEIRAAVGDVAVLREIYEPKLLHETTKSDAEMTLNSTVSLLEIVRSIQA